MDDIKTELKTIRESQIRMEEDVRHHIKRSDKHEEKIVPLWTAYIGARWTVAAILTTGAVVAAILKIQGIL
jgi:hypothetical protein